MNRIAIGISSALILLIIIVSLASCSSKELSEKPPLRATQPSFDTKDSVIGAEAVVTLADIKALIDARMPRKFNASGNGEDLCADLGWLGKHCVGTKYDIDAQTGTSTLSAVNPSTIRLAIPVSFSGHGGFRGDGCRLLSCSAKNFNGGALMHIDVSPSVGSDFCPSLNSVARYVFTPNPRVEIVGGVWVDVSGQVRGAIDAKMAEIRNAINAAVDCKLIKRELEKVYVSQGFPVTLPDKTKVFVNVTPTGIGLSNPGIDPDKIRVSGLVTAKVEVSTTMLVPAPIALPPKQTVPPGAPLMNVALPLRAPYDTIRTVVLRAITGKDFAEDTPAGKVNVTINDVEIYPSGERLVIGLKVSAKLPSSWFNTSGDVYLFAKPVVDGPSRIHLADIGFARKLDNDFWNATTAIFQRQIIGALAEASRYDLATDIENAKEVLNHALRDPKATPGVKVAVTEVSMGLGRISIAEKELSVEGLFSGKMTISPGS